MSQVSRSLILGVLAWAACGRSGVGQTTGLTTVDLRTQSKSVDFSAANATRPFKSGTALPAICAIGEMFYKTDAPAGANLYGCVAPNAWAAEGQGGNGGLPPAAGNNGGVLTTDGTSATWTLLGGDLTGRVNTATVVQIQGRAISPIAPQQGQALIWNTATNRWEPQAAGSGGGGAGISLLAQSGDLLVARLSASTLSIGANCSPATPCNVRFGSLVFSILAGASATVTAGTGTALFYVTSSGTLTVGHNVTASCSSTCFAQSGVTGFPPDSIPLFSWSATNGAWDVNGGADLRAFSSVKVVQAGAGLTSVDSGGATVIGADSNLLSLRTGVPSVSNSACAAGSWAMDASFYYLCVSSGSWRRAALASF
jgi:hypothetical protein